MSDQKIQTKSLRTAEDVAERTGFIVSAAKLTELAQSGYMPCYWLPDGEVRFKTQEVEHWLSNNWIGRQPGANMPDRIKVVALVPGMVDKPPASIANIRELGQIHATDYAPGVYFLCRGNEVVYVGQSTAPSARITSHWRSPSKKFDRVYLLPVPESDLNDTEAAFIQMLRPEQQGNASGGDKLSSPRCRQPADEVIARHTEEVSHEAVET